MSLPSLADAFADFLQNAKPDPSLRSGTFKDDCISQVSEHKPKTSRERNAKHDAKRREQRKRNIAILDMETDPFDNESEARIYPFLAVLYSDQFETIVIWEENHDSLIAKIIDAIKALPEPFTIYAHNGGKFDFLFLIHTIRGAVSFKGRGIMSARIGKHELRDSFHVIPERLANIQKDAFDYTNMRKEKRASCKTEIIRYCVSDCAYLFPIIRAFIDEFGLKLSIGQAALCELRNIYPVKRFKEGWDNYARQFYFGGRVECLRGAGDFVGNYKLFDINSSYPDVMANRQHPIGDFHDYSIRAGIPSNDTCFLDLDCTNHGALIGRDENGETVSTIARGRFHTTIHEFEVACRYNLIEDVKINYCIDCSQRTTFRDFIVPRYEKRQTVKAELNKLKSLGMDHGQYFHDLKKDDLFLKLLLNSCYGKFGQDPSRYKEHYITDPEEQPPDEWMASIKQLPPDVRPLYEGPHFEHPAYWIWIKPAPRFHYNNVGVAASVTGAARASLLIGLQHATDPIYCDTDSILCKALSPAQGLVIDKTALGGWDMEDEYSRVIVAGKKLYSVWHKTPKRRSPEDMERGLEPEYTVKSKGTSGLSWQHMEMLLDGKDTLIKNSAPTLTRYGGQDYIKRRIRATARMHAL